jgi:hypothetical protein
MEADIVEIGSTIARISLNGTFHYGSGVSAIRSRLRRPEGRMMRAPTRSASSTLLIRPSARSAETMR